MLAFNSAFNPFVYFIFIQSFRDGFKRVFVSRQNNPVTISKLGIGNYGLARNNHFSFRLEDMNVNEESDKTCQPKLLSFVKKTGHQNDSPLCSE